MILVELELVNAKLDLIWCYVIYDVYVINIIGIESWWDACFIAESVKFKKGIFLASKLALDGTFKSREASNVMSLPI